MTPIEIRDVDRERAALLVGAHQQRRPAGAPSTADVLNAIQSDPQERLAWANVARALAEQLAQLLDVGEEVLGGSTSEVAEPPAPGSLVPEWRDRARVTAALIGLLEGNVEMWATAIGATLADGHSATVRLIRSATEDLAGDVLDAHDDRDTAVALLRDVLATQLAASVEAGEEAL